MEGQTQPDVIGAINGIFGLIGIIVGLCSRKAVNSIRNGAIVGAVQVILFASLLIAGGVPSSPNFDWSYFIGRLIGYVAVSIAFALIGYGIRKLFSLFLGLFRKSKPADVRPEVPSA